MTEFTYIQLIKSGKVRTAYLHRQALLDQLKQNELLIKDLDQDTPNARTFTRLESNANKALEEWKVADRDLSIQLLNANPDIKNDKSYMADQKLARDQQFSLINVIDDYIELLNSKGILYPPDKPESSSGDLAAVLTTLDKSAVAQEKILNTLVASQDKNAAAQADLSKTLVNQLKSHATSRLGPKATQPKFKPKGNDSDYAEFKDFFKEI